MKVYQARRQYIDNPNKGIKVETDCWMEEGKDEYSNIPVNCPICGRRLHRTDASKTQCGLIFVYCDGPKVSKNSCYWCAIYEI